MRGNGIGTRKVLDAIENAEESLCVHHIAKRIGMTDAETNWRLSVLARKGKIHRTLEKITCRYSDRRHFYYNASDNTAMEEKRFGKVKDMLNSEIEQKNKEISGMENEIQKSASIYKEKLNNLCDEIEKQKASKKRLLKLVVELAQELE